MKILFGIFFLLITCFTFGQEPMYRQFSIDDGLPSQEVYSVMQDSTGLLYFVTDRGIASYNGYELKLIPSAANSFPSGFLNSATGRDGRLWCFASDGSVCRLKRRGSCSLSYSWCQW